MRRGDVADKLVGQNYTPPDLVAKVTGKARYAEDFRADGMLFCKLLLEPDAARARRQHRHQRGARDARRQGHPHRRRSAGSRPAAERALTNEPLYAGEPILAVAAVDELTAADADRADPRRSRAAAVCRRSDREPAPGQPERAHRRQRLDAGAAGRAGSGTSRRAPADRRRSSGPPRISPKRSDGRCRSGKPTEEWTFGDLDAGFKNAALVVDETFVVQSTGHHPMETRSAMAYWQNGKLYLHGSTQSVVAHGRRHRALVRHRAVAGGADLRVHAAAASAARAAARCRWRFRRCCRRKPTRR